MTNEETPVRRRRWLVAVVVLVVLLVGAGAGGVLTMSTRQVGVSAAASSTAPGTDALRAYLAASQMPLPAAASGMPASTLGASDGPVASSGSAPAATASWQSLGETSGAWIRLESTAPMTVDHVRIDGAGDPATAFETGLISFDDGSTVMVTPDANGNVSVDIAPRTIRLAQLTIVSARSADTSVALEVFAVDDSGGPMSSEAPTAEVSSGSGTGADAVSDGDIAGGDLGAQWRPASDDRDPWVAQTWPSTVELASVVIAGAVGAGGGTLEFSDGSALRLDGLSSPGRPADTVAFSPRSVRWVRLVMDPGITGIGEFTAYPAGVMPARWPASGDTYAVSASPAECDPTTPTGTAADQSLSLVCPSVGADVGSTATVVVKGLPDVSVRLEGAVGQQPTAPTTLAVTQTDSDGVATLTFDTTAIPSGPFAVRITSDSTPPLYVQLFHTDGPDRIDASSAPAGANLVWSEEFSDPLSISGAGRDAVYAAVKPAGGSSSDFGDAVFADPAEGTDTLATLDGVLRIRAEPLGSSPDPSDWGRDHESGLLSSVGIGGVGFSAQYGYFEARMLAPAGQGTWPSFWALDTPNSLDPDGGAGEVDAVELYGGNPLGSCHTIHNWPASDDTTSPPASVDPYCIAENGLVDWALAWHTYGVRIRPGGADFYIDGRFIASREGLERDQLPYFFLVDLSLGGGWPIDLAPTGDTVDLYVDWVRVFV